MTNDLSPGRLDAVFQAVRGGDQQAFAEWMGMVEIPLRRSLNRYARLADLEVVLQETLMRMWLLAMDPQRKLDGSNASLKFAHRVARNVALEEIRRVRPGGKVDLTELEHLPEGRLQPEPPDPALGNAIDECVQRLPSQPRKALLARIHEACLPDRTIAGALSMKTNTFLQNIVRARRLVAECLERRGIDFREMLA